MGYRMTSKRRQPRLRSFIFLLLTLFLLCWIAHGDDDANYGNDDQNNVNGDDYYAAAGDDDAANQAAGDDAANDDGQQNVNYAGDDAAADDFYANQNDGYQVEKAQYQDTDDDQFVWNQNIGFDGVSIMPLSCINYNNGHMIKFQLYDSARSYQCHFAEISTFVVSIAHYMRAYFNYQAITDGNSFSLPEDAAYLNCIQVKSVYTSSPLYAKIGCKERETFTSTRLQLRVYTDAQCSQPYNDGQTARQHGSRGYQVEDALISSKVSFGLPFYSCLTCSPEQVSETFNKMNGNWYDDDFISQYNRQNDNNEEQGDDVVAAADDRYYQNNDDINVDDQAGDGNDDGGNDQDDGAYNYDYYQDDYYGGRKLMKSVPLLSASRKDLKAYHDDFWREIREIRRLNDYYSIGSWNMCQRIYKYGLWCDSDCRALDYFRADQWSQSDILLLGIMCTFLTGMMILVVAKRLKAQQKARLYGDAQPMPGLPPFGMTVIFAVTMTVIISLAKLKFINETLIFAVVTCILLFIYMLKLTLFENRRPVILAGPRHDMFDNINQLDDHLMS